MTDPRALTRVMVELLWSLRREGFAIATSQSIDVLRAVRAVGLADPGALREAIGCIVVDRARERRRFDAAFNRFFAPDRAQRGTLWERLAARGFDDDELAELRTLLRQLEEADGDAFVHLGTLLERGADLDRLLQLAGVSRALDAVQSPLQTGFYAHRVLQQLEMPRAYQSLGALRLRLIDALGERGEALADALRDELARAGDEVRAHVRERIDRRVVDLEPNRPRRVDSAPFATLSDDEIAEVTRAVRAFVERLRGESAFGAGALSAGESIPTAHCAPRCERAASPLPPHAAPGAATARGSSFCATSATRFAPPPGSCSSSSTPRTSSSSARGASSS